MSGHMHNPQLPRRTSRNSGSQPVCRSSRVEKVRSHHNSPRTMERRKTTTEPKLYATLDDHYRMMFGVEPEAEDVFDERPQSNRPMSWHPSSAHMQGYRPSSYFEAQQDWSQQYSPSPPNSTHGSDYYSLSTRNSAYEPMYKHATYPGAYAVHSGLDDSDRSLQETPSYVHSVVNTPVSEPLPWYLQQWAQQNQTQATLGSLNGSPAFLPIQHPATRDEEMYEGEGEKLVALGLYDLPEPSQSWNAFTEPTGKGLKLEETWQPPTDQDENDEEEVADDASSEASMDEPSPPLPSTHQQSQQLQMPVDAKAPAPNNMEGQSFFFDDEEAVSKEWWFQQLRQPSNPVREHGLGYGWL